MAKKSKTTEWEMEMYEREARQRSLWSEYMGTMATIRAQDEERQIQIAHMNNDKNKVKEIEKNRDSRTGLIYIG